MSEQLKAISEARLPISDYVTACNNLRKYQCNVVLKSTNV